jgi:hypothetical protein
VPSPPSLRLLARLSLCRLLVFTTGNTGMRKTSQTLRRGESPRGEEEYATSGANSRDSRYAELCQISVDVAATPRVLGSAATIKGELPAGSALSA